MTKILLFFLSVPQFSFPLCWFASQAGCSHRIAMMAAHISRHMPFFSWSTLPKGSISFLISVGEKNSDKTYCTVWVIATPKHLHITRAIIFSLAEPGSHSQNMEICRILQRTQESLEIRQIHCFASLLPFWLNLISRKSFRGTTSKPLWPITKQHSIYSTEREDLSDYSSSLRKWIIKT